MSHADVITKRLVKRGQALLKGPVLVPDAGSPEATALVGDLKRTPHAFVLACIMDRQIKAERAWALPWLMSERLGGFEFDRLASLNLSAIRKAMGKPTPLHRFVDIMSKSFYEAVRRIEGEYQSDASLLWADKPSSAEVVYRFLQFRGVGPKIATMAANLLVRNYKVELADYYSIDVSADVHVRRVFERLKFVNPNSTIDQVIYRARALHPRFPGLLDQAAWEVGRKWCRPQRPLCSGCWLRHDCPSSSAGPID